MDSLMKFFTRLIAPIIFSVAIIFVINYYAQFQALQEAIEQDETEQSVVTQMLPVTNDRTVSYSELISLLMGGVTVDTMISIPDQFVRILIQVENEEYTVTVMQSEQVCYAETIPKQDWYRSDFPYSCIANAMYNRIETYYLSGEIKSVTYVKKS